jgi:hypothetical protein
MADHGVGIRLAQGPGGELFRAAPDRRVQRALGVGGDPGTISRAAVASQ